MLFLFYKPDIKPMSKEMQKKLLSPGVLLRLPLSPVSNQGRDANRAFDIK